MFILFKKLMGPQNLDMFMKYLTPNFTFTAPVCYKLKIKQ
jgi:hypothetical protein